MLLGLATTVLLSGAAPTAAHPGMPAEIAAYYRAYNFVNAFSTRAERRVVARSTTVPKDRRLASVARALARLADSTEGIDPGIVYEQDAGRSLRRHESEFSSHLAEVRSWHSVTESEAWIELEFLSLPDDVAGLLVADFDRLTQGGESMPEADQLIAFGRRLPMRTVVRHRWQRLEGEWRRAAAVFVFT
jgi:hypothetical protein